MDRDRSEFPGKPLWLDRHLALRLTAHFRCSYADLPGGFVAALRLWQWEKLRDTFFSAVDGSLHYRTIRRDGAFSLSPEIAGHAGFSEIPAASPAGRLGSARIDEAIRRELEQLPFTLPEQLADAPESFLAVGHNDVSGLISLPTSGTTGRGKRIFCTEDDLSETAAFFRHGMQYMVRPGGVNGREDHVVLLMSGDRPGSVGDLLRRGMADLGVPCTVAGFVRPGPGGEEAMLEQLIRLRPTCLVGVPGQLFSLARHPGAAKLEGSVRSVLLSGDAVTPPLREGIDKGFGCKVHVHYGLTETGLGGAVECSERDGGHMREADLIHEILDADGKALPHGRWGEVVITTLTRRAMPLLRYRTGDEGCILPAPCVCGSILGRLKIRGRISQSIDLSGGGRLHMTDIDQRLYALPFVQRYAATLHERGSDGGKDCLVLDFRRTPDAPENAGELAAEALSRLQQVRIIYGSEDLESTAPGLPLLIRTSHPGHEKGDGDDVLRHQAKQSIRRSTGPVFGPDDV